MDDASLYLQARAAVVQSAQVCLHLHSALPEPLALHPAFHHHLFSKPQTSKKTGNKEKSIRTKKRRKTTAKNPLLCTNGLTEILTN